MTIRLCILLLVLALSAGGCAWHDAPGPGDIVIAPGQYTRAFETARESLIDLGFELDRVDARLGIIVTLPKSTSGLASPWDREQTTIGQEFEEMVNRHFRRAVITFRLPGEPEHLPPAQQTVPAASPADLRESAEPLVARVEVILERQRRPGWRIEPAVLRMSSRALDPEYRGTGMWPSYNVPFSRDGLLAERIAAKIRAVADAR